MDMLALYLAHGLGGPLPSPWTLYLAHGLSGPLPSPWTCWPFT